MSSVGAPTGKADVDHLFVYGTLQPGGPNEHVLEDLDGSWETGSVRGHFHQLGWGAGMGYPALELDPDGAEVHGQIFTSPDLAGHWDRLDSFEGAEYERVTTEVTLASGTQVLAYLYVLGGVGELPQTEAETS